MPKPAATPAGTRAFATLLFSDLCDSVRLSATLDPESLASFLESLRATVETIVAQHGGALAQVYGDGCLSVFPARFDRVSDGMAALDAALAIHAAVAELVPPAPGERVAMHSGAHCGMVLLRPGDPARGAVEALGLATSIAARLSAAAGRNELLASEGTLGPARRHYRLGPPRAVDLDRGQDRIDARPVLARLAMPRTGEGGVRRSPFVGRAAELARMLDALAPIGEGRPVRIAIVAPAGQGKSRLVEELGARAAERGVAVFAGACPIDGDGPPLQPFRQIARAMLARPGFAEGVGHGDQLAEKLERFATESGRERRSAEDDFPEVVATIAEHAPILLLLDDWQWADSQSLLMLDRLGAIDGPLGIILASREADRAGLPLEGFPVHPLPPLEAHESVELVRHCGPHLDPIDAARIHARAGGNPLYVEELCYVADARPWGGRPPDRDRENHGWLGSLIGARVAALPPEEYAVIEAAAVIGPEPPLWLLGQLLGGPPGDSLLARIGSRDLLIPGTTSGTLRFKHGITWEVIYGLVPAARRAALHAAVARAIEAHGDLPEIDRQTLLARHHGASGNDEAASLAALAAGELAGRLGSLDRARFHYRTALDALDRLPHSPGRHARAMDLVSRLGMVSVFDAEPEEQRLFEAAIARARAAGDAIGEAVAEYWAGYVAYALGDRDRSVAHCKRALERARAPADSPFTVQLNAVIGQAEALAANYDVALPLLDGAIAIKRQHRSGRQASLGLAYTLTSRAAVLGDLGRFDEAHQTIAEALALMDGASHPVEASIANWGGALMLWQGRFDEAARLASRASAVAMRVETVYLHAMSRAIAAYSRFRLSDDPASITRLAEATACMTERGKTLCLSFAYGWLAEAAALAGDRIRARDAIARALERSRLGDHLGGAMAARAAARLAAERGRHLAEAWLVKARAIAARRCSPHEAAANDLVEAELALARGEEDMAAPLAARARAAFHGLDMAWHTARADAILSASRS